MTNPTPQDREMAEADASQIAISICGCANREQHRRDVATLIAYAEAARLQGRREGLEESARVAEEMIPLPGSDMQMNWTPAQTLFAAATAIRKLGEA